MSRLRQVPTVWVDGNIYKFDQWASDPNLIATSQQDAIDHPEKYPYNSFSNGAQQLGTAVFKDINGDRVIDSKDMVPDSYTIIPEIDSYLQLRFRVQGLRCPHDCECLSTVALYSFHQLSATVVGVTWVPMR